jgi:hypothetical protein
MREIRKSGSEGGGVETNRRFLPLSDDLHGAREPEIHLLVSSNDAGSHERGRRRGGGLGWGRWPMMTRLAPLITGFLRDYMPRQRGYSPLSCETCAHSFKLLFAFAAKRTGTQPSQLHIEQLDAALILDFLAMSNTRYPLPWSRSLKSAPFRRSAMIRHSSGI